MTTFITVAETAISGGVGLNTTTYREGESFDFELPCSEGSGESRTAATLATGHDHVLVVLLRGHYCPRSRRCVAELSEAYEAFAARTTAVVPVLPDRRERAGVWQRRYDLPLVLLADPNDGSGAESTDPDDGFGTFAPFASLLTRRPGAALFEGNGDELLFRGTVRCTESISGVTADALLASIDECGRDELVGPVESSADAGTLGGD